MLPLSILERTDTSILYEIPAGKQNPKETCSVGEDNRERVRQSADKGNTCWYYTFNFIRKRIGKNPSKELTKERESEKLYSSLRKALTRHENSLPAIADLLCTEEATKTLENLNLERVALLMVNKEALKPTLDMAGKLEGRPSLFSFLEEFINENKCKNMHEFLLNKKLHTRNTLKTTLLINSGVDINKLFESEISIANGYDKIAWEKLDIATKSAFLDFFSRDAAAKAYGLHKSSWTPLKGIDGLITELKEKGPLFIGGAFGQSAYIDKPYKMTQQIAERDVYAWNPRAKRHPTTFLGHAVLLIGAKKIQDKALVYFINSQDPSDPKDKSLQKIYAMSFTNLTSNIFDLHGRIKEDSNVGYAYHGNFNLGKPEILHNGSQDSKKEITFVV